MVAGEKRKEAVFNPVFSQSTEHVEGGEHLRAEPGVEQGEGLRGIHWE